MPVQVMNQGPYGLSGQQMLHAIPDKVGIVIRSCSNPSGRNSHLHTSTAPLGPTPYDQSPQLLLTFVAPMLPASAQQLGPLVSRDPLVQP